MNNILSQIIEQKQIEIAKLDQIGLRHAAESTPVPHNFLESLPQAKFGQHVHLIAELKRASPSRGLLAPHLNLMEIASIYVQNGAAAISVLTDERFFLGTLTTLQELRFSFKSPVPLLRKDFIIAESQVYESRVNGADAILLISAALPDNGRLAALLALSIEIGLTPLVEVHNEAEIERVLYLDGVELIGINNRNLSTFEVSLTTTERLRPLIPPHITVVSESGIFKSDDVSRLARIGVDAVLVGEALVTSPDIAARVRELTSIMGER